MWVIGEPVEKVCIYKYLGTIVNDSNDYSPEIRLRIGQARTVLNKMRNVLTRCYVFPVLPYGMKVTLKKGNTERLEAFEMQKNSQDKLSEQNNEYRGVE